MTLEALARLVIPIVLAVGAAVALDRMTAARGLQPPGFREPWRRSLALALITGILWIGTFATLGEIGRPAQQVDVSGIAVPELFLLHAMLVATLLTWFLLGFAGVRAPAPPPPPELQAAEPPGEPGMEAGMEAVVPAGPPPVGPPSLAEQFRVQFGFRTPSVARELGLGLLLGVGAWGLVLTAVVLIAMLVVALGGEKAIPQQPPQLIPFMAALPIGVRLLVSLSAGVVEETFFRGFLQPRIGIALSTVLFALAHASYGQPFLLVGVTLLSVLYGLIVKWRQNIWPAIAAHVLFDAVQLLVMIPMALRMIEKAPAP